MFSIFVAWGIKKIILRTGGATAYRRFRPLFLGVFVGYALSVLASYLIDQIWFPARGHFVHAW